MRTFNAIHLALLSGLALSLPACDEPVDDGTDMEFRSGGAPHKPAKVNEDGYNLHLQRTVRFPALFPGADAERGRQRFGINESLDAIDQSNALFEGFSVASQKEITSNGRTCFTCHRGLQDELALPPPPLTDTIPLTDPLFTGIEADAQGDPDAFHNLDQLGLLKYRPNRFDPRKPQSNGFRKVFGWRKSIQLLNVSLNNGFLNDLRGRVMNETARGAAFAHTQSEDDRFDDLFTLQDGTDIEAFLATQFTDPLLAALRDPNDPMFDTLVEDPFYTVDVQTKAQKRGLKVFKKNCFGACHNMPQIFSNLDNVEPLGNGDRPPSFPGWAPAVSRTFNVGVAERNAHGLRFTEFVGPGQFEDIVVPLADEDGGVNMHTVEFDIGLAATTGRTVDIGRFKVPQLRNLVNNAPYFHDNSAATIEDVVDYFDSDDYNMSADGHEYPINLSGNEKADLIEFLYIL